ncbi:hypothetical protein KL86PLE_20046 [uncultured Pleomorphomonas sp.]|uniref:Uncharacterized protein n=1 Tax=uncultured Pleomorphomonas sp. TaxID=442121 RepID=A0A212LD20_9HYPH|nr:hypothetical protein KL86PLE_20046 [uncultured Pleomorphomonas sp.]
MPREFAPGMGRQCQTPVRSPPSPANVIAFGIYFGSRKYTYSSENTAFSQELRKMADTIALAEQWGWERPAFSNDTHARAPFGRRRRVTEVRGGLAGE